MAGFDLSAPANGSDGGGEIFRLGFVGTPQVGPPKMCANLSDLSPRWGKRLELRVALTFKFILIPINRAVGALLTHCSCSKIKGG